MLKFIIFPAFIVFWIVNLFSQIMMIFNRKAGVRLFDASLFGNPFAIQFFGRKYLSKRGVFWRNISWMSAVGLVFGILGILSTKPG
jgi:hypothetical protein